MGENEIPFVLTDGKVVEYDRVLDSCAIRVHETLYYKKVEELNKKISDLNTLKEMNKDK